jgi:hypothetical protein
MKVYQDYIAGTQGKQNWNIKRILAANNYKIMSDSVHSAHNPTMPYHYSNEAKMLNTVLFGKHEDGLRDSATEEQLDTLSWLERHNATLIDIGWDYAKRKETLIGLLGKRNTKAIGA